MDGPKSLRMEAKDLLYYFLFFGIAFLFSFLLIVPFGAGYTFEGGSITGAAEIVTASSSFAGGSYTGRITMGAMPGGAATGSEPKTRVGIVADEILPIVVVSVNNTDYEGCTTQGNALTVGATITGSDACTGWVCDVCVSSDSSTCDGTWTTTNVAQSFYNHGCSIHCIYTLAASSAPDLNATDYEDGLYFFFRATSPLDANNFTSTGYLVDSARPMVVDLFSEDVDPANYWTADNGATWAQLNTYCLGYSYNTFELTGNTTNSYSFIRGMDGYDTWMATLFWEQGSVTRYARSQVPDTQGSSTMNMFAFDANDTTAYSVRVNVRDFPHLFSTNQSYVRVRGYLNGSMEYVMSDVIGDSPSKDMWFVGGNRYHWRLNNELDTNQWDAGPVLIASTDPQALYVQYVDFSSSVQISSDYVWWGWTFSHSAQQILTRYRRLSGSSSTVWAWCANATDGNGTVVDSSYSTSGDWTWTYNVPNEAINDTFFCNITISHPQFETNITDARFIRLRPASGMLLEPGGHGTVIDATQMGRMSFFFIMAVAAMFTAANAEVGAVVIPLLGMMFYYLGWISFSSSSNANIAILTIALALGIGARLKK